MKAYRVVVVLVAAIGLVAGVVALAAAAWTDRDCETFPDANDPATSHQPCGPVLDRYRAEGGPAVLGLPMSDERPVTLESARRLADRETAFAQGMIYRNSETGRVSVGRWYAYTPLQGRGRR